MKRLLFILACLTGCLHLIANPVTASQARQKASQFLNKRVAKRARAKAPAANALKLMAAGKDDSYFIFNAGDDGGYVVVSGEDATEEILGYSDTGNINPDSMPCGMRMLLDSYEDQIKFLRDNRITREQNCKMLNTSNRRASSNSFHLVKSRLAKYDQETPYNDFCPHVNGNLSVTGCAATAMAELMYYYKWPSQTTTDIPGYSTANFSVDGFSANTQIGWSNIIDQYNTYYLDLVRHTLWDTPEQATAIANLMKMAGVSVHMDYNSVSNAYNFCIPFALKKYFGYESANLYYRKDYNDEVWNSMLCSQLESNGPIIYFGSGDTGGHFFMLEGYKYDDDYYYDINFGWDGRGNDRFLLTIVKDAFHYVNYQSAVLDVKPQSTLMPIDVPLKLYSYEVKAKSADVYTRSSETEPFSNMAIYIYIENKTPIETDFDYGFVFYDKKGNAIDHFYFDDSFSFKCGGTADGNLGFSCGSNLLNGYYDIKVVSKEHSSDNWLVNDNSDKEFVNAVVCNNKLSLKYSEPVAAQLNVSEVIQTSETPLRVGQSSEFSCVVTNLVSPAIYEGGILIKQSDNDDVFFIDNLQLNGSSSKQLSFTFTPTTSGNYELVFLNKRWEEIGRKKVKVTAANASLDMLEVTNLTLIDGDLDQGLIDGTLLHGKISLKNHDIFTKKSSITICLYDTETQQTKYKPIFVHIAPNNTVTYDFSFSNLIDGHHYEVYGTYASGEEFYRSPQLLCTTAGMGETESGNEDLVAYEYWFDNNVANRKTVNLSGNDAIIRAHIDTYGLSVGLHRFNFRLKRSDGMYSSVTTSTFMNMQAENEGRIVYWFDDTIDQTESTPLSDTENEQTVTLDLQNMEKFPLGLHQLNMRVATKGSSLSNIYTARVLKMASGEINQIEYWVDDDYKHPSIVPGHVASNDDKSFIFVEPFDLKGQSSGPHRVYFRAVSKGRSTSSAVSMASVVVGGGTPEKIEYWFDNDATNSATVPLPPSALKDTIDVALVMSNAEKFPLGMHQLNMRLVTEGREQSPVYTTRILKMASGATDQLEYWVDNDFEHAKRVSGSVASSDANSYIFKEPFDLSGIPAGLHTVYYRAASSKGVANSAISKATVVIGGGETTKLEYWFDGDYEHSQTLSAEVIDNKESSVDKTISLSDVSPGVHRMYYRGVNDSGVSKTAVSMTPVLVKSLYGGGEPVLSSFTIGVDDVVVDNGKLNGENEQLFIYTLDAKDLTLGDHTLKASFMNSFGVRITEQFSFRVIERPPFILGDANNDMKVTITDAVAIVNFILGNPSENINKAAANVNGDLDEKGEPNITITDAVGVVNIILNSGGGSSAPKLEAPDAEIEEAADPE